MVRDDDIDVVPGLGPAAEPDDRPLTRPAPRREATPRPAPKLSQPAGQAGGGGGGHGVIYLLLVLLLAATGGASYWLYERQQAALEDVVQLQEALQIASQKIAVLESLINATDENASKSGAALQAQVRKLQQESEARVKFVDSEIAKLWTVAYQRNKPKLEALEKRAAELDKQLAALEKQVKSAAGDRSRLAERVGGIDERLKDSTAKVAELSAALERTARDYDRLAEQMRLRDQAAQELADLQDAQLRQLGEQLRALQSAPPVAEAVSRRLDEYARALESVNAFRRQANQELLRLRDRINDVQLRLDQLAPATPRPATPG